MEVKLEDADGTEWLLAENTVAPASLDARLEDQEALYRFDLGVIESTATRK